MTKAIHQVVIGASEGDAITSMALSIRDSLREFTESEIFARWVFSDSLKDDIKLLDEMPPSALCDRLVYHSSYGLPLVTSLLLERSEDIAVIFHNFTPWQTYLRWNPDFAVGLDWGRRELELIKDKVTSVIADSTFNARDLEELGYSNIEVVPLGINLDRLLNQPTNSALLRNLAESYPNGYVLAVSQILHHKRIEQLMETVHLLNFVHETGLGLIIAGVSRQPAYLEALEKHGKSLPHCNVRFLGSVSDRELATLYRGADVFLSMSDHEGFGIPPVEAMAFGVPVVVKGAGALPETVGEGGLVLPPDASPALAAEALAEVLSNEILRRELIGRGLQQVKKLMSGSDRARVRDIILGNSR